MPKTPKNIIDPIKAGFDEVTNAMLTRTHKPNEINELHNKSSNSPAPYQSELFKVDTQVEYENIEMGVLESGIPYLSEAGLCRLCDIDRKTLYEISSEWDLQRLKPRGKAIDQLLKTNGYELNSLFIKAEYNGAQINAYTEPVCMAILEYYAFEANETKQQAIRAYRNLAKLGLREFVYKATGYSPEHKALDSWKHFHDRTDLTMDAAPFGYFGVFREIAIMIIPMIRAGIMISDRVVPDISVGRAWSSFWEENRLSDQFGEREKYEHEYPDYYPQAKSNPQPSYCYPNGALGIFREWLQNNYIKTKFPNFLVGQINKKTIDRTIANKAILSFGGDALPEPKTKKLS